MKKKIIILFLVLSIVLSLKFFLDNDKKFSFSKDQALFENLKSDQIIGIKIIKESKTIEVLKTASLETTSPIIKKSNWLLNQSGLIPADEEIVNDLIKKLSLIKVEKLDKQVSDNISEADLGLSPPESFIFITDSNQEKKIISIGSKNPVTQTRYLQIEADKNIYKYTGDFLDYFDTASKNIRSPKILRIDPSSIISIEVIEGDNFFRLENKACDNSSSWSIRAKNLETENLEDSADEDFTREKIKSLSNISVSKIYESPGEILPFTGLDNPFLILNLKLRNATDDISACGVETEVENKDNEIVLQFGKGIGSSLLSSIYENSENIKPKQFFFLKISGQPIVYELERSFIGDWLQGADHFRLRKPLSPIKREDLKTISISNKLATCSHTFSEGDKSKQIAGIFNDFSSNLKFDTILKESEVLSLEEDKNLDLTIQENNNIYQLRAIRKISSNNEIYSSILEFKKNNKPAYVGSISYQLKTELEKYLTSICETIKNK